MRSNTKTDYCLRVLIYLQSHSKKAKIQEIADAYGISKNHLSVAVNKLSELDYIITTQGPKGGIELNKKSLHKTVGQLVSQVEDFKVVECFDSKTNSCQLSPICKLKGMLSKATTSFLGELKSYKIKDLV